MKKYKLKNLTNLNAETLCDYYVDEKTKKLWNIQLNMLDKFIEICNKYDLYYWMDAGSILGAIRHKGYIPWDDDIDIGMYREDYNKFLKIAENELKSPLFLQTPYTDNIYRGHAQIRNSETTMILKGGELLKYNQGIFIDIFPFDVVPDKGLSKIEKQKLKYMTKIMCWKMENFRDNFKNKTKYVIASVFFGIISYKKFYALYEKECSKYNNSDGKVAAFSYTLDNLNLSFEKNIFDNLIEVPFEKLIVKIPKDYDFYLKKTYGNYMKYVRGSSDHGEAFIDTENSYKKYLK